MSEENFTALIRRDGSWGVRRTGSSRCRIIRATKMEAWREAKKLARQAKGVAWLLGEDGRIASRVSYAE